MTLDTAASLYFCAGFLLLAWMAVLDRHSVREAFVVSALWPLTLVLLGAMGLGLLLTRLGFNFYAAPPRAGVRWGVGRVKLKPGATLDRRPLGFWVTCPVWGFALWWSRPL